MSLSGKTVLITGGGGVHGMGGAMVRLFHGEGARVIAVDVSREGLEAIAAELPDVVTVEADISTPEGADEAIAAAGDRLDVLCNHAGVAEKTFGGLENISEDEWARTLGINLTGPFLLCKRALPMMVEQGAGVITNTSSASGLRGGRAGPAYISSKWGLVGLTQNIAAYYANDGIRCNAICPGPAGEHRGARGNWGLPQDFPGVTERDRLILTRDRDKPDPCPPELVANVAVFLARDEAARINGAIIPVDGGWIAF